MRHGGGGGGSEQRRRTGVCLASAPGICRRDEEDSPANYSKFARGCNVRLLRALIRARAFTPAGPANEPERERRRPRRALLMCAVASLAGRDVRQRTNELI